MCLIKDARQSRAFTPSGSIGPLQVAGSGSMDRMACPALHCSVGNPCHVHVTQAAAMFACDTCGEVASSAAALRTHVRAHHRAASAASVGSVGSGYSCEICGVEGLSENEMRTHTGQCHVDGAVSCPFCDLGDVTPAQMRAHVDAAHLDFLTPEDELLAFIDDETDSEGATATGGSWPRSPDEQPRSANGWANNINNNFSSALAASNSVGGGGGGAGGHGSPLRAQMSLDLRAQAGAASAQPCPMCTYRSTSPGALEEHLNRAHFDLTSPSLFPAEQPSPPTTPTRGAQPCPLCARSFRNVADLELHVNIEHRDILSPAKPSEAGAGGGTEPVCPVCLSPGRPDLAAHIDAHFRAPPPDVAADRRLARDLEQRDREARRRQEQHDFHMLRAQYGMDNQGNFREQSLSNMQKAVYAGEMSVKAYYEKQVELRAAESSGVDDGSSATSGLLPRIRAASAAALGWARTLTATSVDHYASTYGDKGWGCGYRNLQMLLSSLLSHTGYNERAHGGLFPASAAGNGTGGPGRSAMPSISRLQRHIESAWAAGWDAQGCDQLGGKLADTRKWIGATEVVTALSALRIRCTLVDFHRPTAANGAHPDLFNWVLQYFSRSADEFTPPLYLQHQGHSRTIVGVEQHKDGSLFLLVLDPSHSVAQMAQFHSTATAPAALRLVRKSQAAMKARQYQLVAVTGLMDSRHELQASKLLRSVRVPQDR